MLPLMLSSGTSVIASGLEGTSISANKTHLTIDFN